MPKLCCNIGLMLANKHERSVLIANAEVGHAGQSWQHNHLSAVSILCMAAMSHPGQGMGETGLNPSVLEYMAKVPKPEGSWETVGCGSSVCRGVGDSKQL